MKLKYIKKYPYTLKNIGLMGTIKLMFNLPFYNYKRASTRYFETKVNNYRMLLDLQDKGISRDLFLYGTREKEHIVFLQGCLKKGMAALDIGANIGYYSTMMGKMVGEEGKIYAVEPSMDNFNLLSLNVKLNGMDDIVDTYHVGISDKTGMGKFYQSEKSNWHTFYPEVHSGTSTESLVDTQPIDVPTITIKDFIEGKRKIELIRMDIEGYEVEVLESIIPLVQEGNFTSRILFEVHQPRYDDSEHNMKDCLRRLFDCGYYVKQLASHVGYKEREGREMFLRKGYKAVDLISSDGVEREIFNDISNEDAITFMCETDFVRTVLLEYKT